MHVCIFEVLNYVDVFFILFNFLLNHHSRVNLIFQTKYIYISKLFDN